ncbi:MAG: hypothetical protein LBT59_13105 [Clostridiales bacterium]|nr:hypothetical protein [Clostridiales bacterium]
MNDDANNYNKPDNSSLGEAKTIGIKSMSGLGEGQCRFSPAFTSIKYRSRNSDGAKILCVKKLSEFEDGELATITPLMVEYIPTAENMELLLEHYGCDVKYNMIRHTCDLWVNGELDDTIFNSMNRIKTMCKSQSFKPSAKSLDEMLLTIAKKNIFNPWQDYLEVCERAYDGKTDYVGQLCDTTRQQCQIA